MNENLVSIIMPNYNGGKFIAQAINSVINQTYKNWELIIVDDYSTDNSVEIISAFLVDNRIKFIRNESNQRTAKTRNNAVEIAQGKYIAFLDSDDIWMLDKLEKQLKCFSQKKQIAIVYSHYSRMDENGNDLGKVIKSKTNVTYNDMLKTNAIGCLTAIYDVSKTGKRYFINHRYEDYICWLFILKDGFVASGIDDVLAKYRISTSSYSANKIRAATWQWSIYRNILGINIVYSLWYFLHYAYHGLKKHS